MSDMSTSVIPDFTVRDLNRHPSRVLEACDRVGVVHIRSHKGRVYRMQAETSPEPATPAPDCPDFAARRRALGMPRMTKAQSEMPDRLIAGE